MNKLTVESNVRSYCRRMPSMFVRSLNAEVWDDAGGRHLDLLSACGALNYGHNHPDLIKRLTAYIQSNGICAAMDLNTVAKLEFLTELDATILQPRGLSYKVQFPGPTGTNAIEAALKLARKVTRRQAVVSFSNGFHGMTLGALAATGNGNARRSAGVPLGSVVRLPYDNFSDFSISALDTYAAMVEGASGGMEPPAAFLLETVQGEGGLNVASGPWLYAVQRIATRLGALLIVDDVQAGCGRTGTFFSFERSGVIPDIVCLAKSIGGIGLPLALVLLKPELDIWEPGEHSGTFRANGLALVTGTAALEFWRNDAFAHGIQQRSALITEWIDRLCSDYPDQLKKKGIGMMQGVTFPSHDIASAVADGAVRRGLILECCGPDDEVVKIMPPLTIEPDLLLEALARLRSAIEETLHSRHARFKAAAA